MLPKPKHWDAEYAEPFQDPGVAQAYQYRPAYPTAVFDLLAGLITARPRHVLDVGCGSGDIARHLVEHVDRLDAVDMSRPMLEQGQRLAHGNDPRLRWLQGRVEEVELDPSYALVTAGASLHWMEWQIVLPRFHDVLTKGGYLALVEHETTPDPWSMLNEIIPRYKTNADYQPSNLIEELERRRLFQKVGEMMTAPVSFVQSIDEYLESYHSRSGFSRQRMGQAQADAFDQEARQILLRSYGAGVVTLQVVGMIVWGLPGNF